MDSRRFDRLTRTLGTRLSRRSAMAAGAGLGGLALGAAVTQAAAQEATPIAGGTPAVEGEKLFFLFVQTFDSGSLAPKPGEEGTYVLTLNGDHGRTIAFSDRPDRIVVSVPTQQFLDGLGFSPENPPNAALVIEPAPGETDVIVLELLNPKYDEAAQTLTYDVTVLDSFVTEQGLNFVETPRAPHADGEEFRMAQLFIDDCPDLTACYELLGDVYIGEIPGGARGQCWSWDDWTCAPEHSPCNGTSAADLGQLCNDNYVTCFDTCFVK